jgi:hypothetical protein
MNNSNQNLEQALVNAIERAEKAAKIAEKAAKKAKKAAKKVEKTRLKIKASKKRIVALQRTSDDKSDALRDEIIEIASKAAKKNKALKKIAKMNMKNKEA